MRTNRSVRTLLIHCVTMTGHRYLRYLWWKMSIPIVGFVFLRKTPSYHVPVERLLSNDTGLGDHRNYLKESRNGFQSLVNSNFMTPFRQAVRVLPCIMCKKNNYPEWIIKPAGPAGNTSPPPTLMSDYFELPCKFAIKYFCLWVAKSRTELDYRCLPFTPKFWKLRSLCK